MKNLVDEGFTTFDLADVYGPAEDYVGVTFHPLLSYTHTHTHTHTCAYIPITKAMSSTVSAWHEANHLVVSKFPRGSRPLQAYHDEYGLEDGAVFNTKWIPTGSSRKDKEIVREAVEKSMGRMKNPQLDLVQFYWWDYDKKNYVEMLQNAQVRTRPWVV
jgi:aryl-alcohol dehydrogenase-like predicted oxidoreductase